MQFITNNIMEYISNKHHYKWYKDGTQIKVECSASFLVEMEEESSIENFKA